SREAESGAGVPPAISKEAAGTAAPHSAKYSDFRHIISQIGEHRGESYFILKSIIINNLFGVDIMEEAVEICKLRLFLKLVAQVEPDDSHPHYGLEPLPDIDFNIRAGNTLVGFASLEQVKQSMEGDMLKLLELPRIEEEAGIVDQAFQQFRRQQTEHGGKVTAEDKQNLRDKLAKLDDELDCYLASEYGVESGAGVPPAKSREAESGAGVPPAISKEAAGTAASLKAAGQRPAPQKATPFEAWKASHQPFHWLVEFYGIMAQGGFDVVIGNPPYVEYSQLKRQYSLKGYKTEQSGNLYAFVLERNTHLAKQNARSGMIIPHSAICTDRMSTVQELFTGNPSATWISTYCIRPAKLFVGVDQRLCIYVWAHSTTNSSLYGSRYHRWHEECRPFLLSQVQYADISTIRFPNSMPKIHITQEVGLWQKVTRLKSISSAFSSRNG
ncbi:MAG: Eco57I restriction-modification methylase domain-containing protein, partial [Kiritimatiellae bacterium]|nr:Eco57I restriction-modification methylase domain-containing protein [Kiritimatiellia bacterium]